MLDLARRRVDAGHDYRDPSLPESVGDQFSAVVKRPSDNRHGRDAYRHPGGAQRQAGSTGWKKSVTNNTNSELEANSNHCGSRIAGTGNRNEASGTRDIEHIAIWN